jgi:hypothetical protein
MLNKRACQKLSTLKPPTKCASIKIMQALITNRNRPSVRIVAGNVSNTNNGFTNPSNKESTTATIRAVNMSLIKIPGSMYASIKTFTAHTNILSNHFCIVIFCLFNRVSHALAVAKPNVILNYN